MHHIILLGKTKNQWLKSIIERLPKTSHERAVVLIGQIRQIFLSLFFKIARIKVIWIADKTNPSIFLKIFSVFADAIIAPNQFIETSYLRSGIEDKKMRLIYPACEFEAKEKNNSNLAVCCDGSMNINDGLNSIMRGVKMASEILGDIKLIIGGDVSDKNSIEWLAQRLDMKKNIMIIHSKTNAWIKSSDIYIYSCNQESQPPISLITAMSFSKPIIADNAHGAREFLKQNENAILIETNNAEMISQAIINLSHDLEWMENMGYNNFLFAREKFSEQCLDRKLGEVVK